VSDYTDKVEVYSIDEVFLDITKVCNIRKSGIKELGLRDVDPFEEAVKIAQNIKQRITREVGDWLRCSIGNKLLAKIASEIKKPDGLTVIRSEEKYQFYRRLELTDVPGIGRRMERQLNKVGIRTLLDLKNCPKNLLTAWFGIITGYHLYNMGQLQGGWKEKFNREEKIKSLGHMYTLPKEFRKSEYLVPVFYKLSEMVARRLRRQGLMGDILHFHIHNETYRCFGKSQRLGFFLFDGREIFLQAMKIFESLQIPKGVYKLIGITVAGLMPFCRQLTLFGEEEKTGRLALAMDRINQKYGDFTICRAPILKAGQVFHDSVGFGRIRELY
jgi:DNA polymerase-4